jgi:diguanylate cyclase (GGDEF)-like protein
MRLSIKYKAALPVLFVALVGVALGALSTYSLQKLQLANQELSHRFHEIEEVRMVESALSMLLYPHQRYVSEHDPRAEAEAKAIFLRIDRLLEDLDHMKAVNAEEKELVRYVKENMAKIKQESGQIFSLPPARTLDGVRIMGGLSQSYLVPLSEKLAEWHVGEVKEVDELNSASQALLAQFTLLSSILIFTMIVLVLMSVWMHSRMLIQPLMTVVEGTGSLAKGNLRQIIDIDQQDEIGLLARNINHMAAALDKLYRELERMTMTDQLTGLLNRHALPDIFSRECNRANHAGSGMGVVLMDIDHFKSVNDRYGHSVGDDVLRHVAAICSEIVRDSDYFFRYGGEEFLLLLPTSSAEEAEEVFVAVERFRKKIAETPWPRAEGAVSLTASFGISYYPTDGEDMRKLLICADNALYQAKGGGRNQAVEFSE